MILFTFYSILYHYPATDTVLFLTSLQFDIYRFIYYEYGEVSTATVIGTLYAAEKYAVTNLVDLCRYGQVSYLLFIHLNAATR